MVGKEKAMGLSTSMAANMKRSAREGSNPSANNKTVAVKSQAIS
jgi:hypothetical protein